MIDDAQGNNEKGATRPCVLKRRGESLRRPGPEKLDSHGAEPQRCSCGDDDRLDTPARTDDGALTPARNRRESFIRAWGGPDFLKRRDRDCGHQTDDDQRGYDSSHDRTSLPSTIRPGDGTIASLGRIDPSTPRAQPGHRREKDGARPTVSAPSLVSRADRQDSPTGSSCRSCPSISCAPTGRFLRHFMHDARPGEGSRGKLGRA